MPQRRPARRTRDAVRIGVTGGNWQQMIMLAADQTMMYACSPMRLLVCCVIRPVTINGSASPAVTAGRTAHLLQAGIAVSFTAWAGADQTMACHVLRRGRGDICQMTRLDAQHAARYLGMTSLVTAAACGWQTGRGLDQASHHQWP